MKKNRNSRELTIILTIYLMGIFFSLIIVRPKSITFSNEGITFIGVLKTFSLNYWYLFVMWILGYTIIGFVFNLLIIFFRGFIYGTLIIYLIKINFNYLILISLLDLVIFIPLFFIISYYSITLSYNIYIKNNIILKIYNKLIFIGIIVILIYSLLLEVINARLM